MLNAGAIPNTMLNAAWIVLIFVIFAAAIIGTALDAKHSKRSKPNVRQVAFILSTIGCLMVVVGWMLAHPRNTSQQQPRADQRQAQHSTFTW